MSLYSKMYPVSVREFDRMADAFCCDSLKYQHGHEADPCGPTCIFCEAFCAGCGVDLF